MTRRTKGLDAMVSVNLELTRIEIDMKRWGELPTVTMRGRVHTRKAALGAQSEALIQTRYISPAGLAFIQEMREAFAAASSDPTTKEPAT